MAAPPWRLGDGVRNAPATNESSENPHWTVYVDNMRPYMRTRTTDGSDGYTAGSWVEVDLPDGFIPAEITELNVYLGSFSCCTTYNGILVDDRAATDAIFGGSTTAPKDPAYLPTYCRPNPATGPTAATISYQDTTMKLMMTGLNNAAPKRFFSNTGEAYFPITSWNWRTGPINVVQAVSNTTYAGEHRQATATPLATMPNPSGGTLRFEMRGAASNAMLCILGSVAAGTNTAFGLSPWQLTLEFVPVQAAQYGNVKQGTRTQFV